MRIFFVGNIGNVWQSGLQRLDTLRALGHEVTTVDYGESTPSLFDRLACRVALACGLPEAPWKLSVINRAVRQTAASGPCPDLVWLEWPRLISRATLQWMKERWPSARFVCFQDDNPFGMRAERAVWEWFIANIPFYDCHIVKRPEDVIHFKKAGARKVEEFIGGYFEPLFDPIACAEAHAPLPAPVIFVGTPLDHRVATIERLLLKEQIDLHIYGGKWDKTRIARTCPQAFSPAVVGPAYAETLASARISLGFVSSSNCDRFTMRTFEIPAAGGFMLAERTPEHLAFYIEGKEAEFFSSPDECVQKIRHYLAHPDERDRIALAGRSQCQRHFGLKTTLRELLERIDRAA